MAKNKRKISKAQRDKTNIEIAKILKKNGILSKQANLHSGNYISPTVLRKVRQYQDIARLNYTAVKVPKETAKAASERGFTVVGGNRIIGPKNTQFRNRLKRGDITGVKPVRGGYMEQVILPHNVYDMRSLTEQLESGIDTLKMPDEQFAFKFYGNESYRAFPDSPALLEYLRQYKSIFDPNGSILPEDLTEEFEALTIFRLHPNDIKRVIPSPTDRRKRTMANRRDKDRRKFKQKTWGEKLASMSQSEADKLKKKKAQKEKARRDKLKNDPAKALQYKEAAKARAKKSRNK